MKKIFAIVTIIAALFLLSNRNVMATPTTTYWTPATIDIQPYKVWHIGIDNYFTLTKGADRGDLPTDLGLTVGVLPYQKIQMEVGIDILEPSTDPLFFNAKIGSPENALFEGSPGLNLGIFNVGTDRKDAAEDKDGRTDFNIIHLMVGKTLPLNLGRLHIGGYIGNKDLLLDKDGEKENSGFMAGYDKGFFPAKDEKGEFNRWIFAADYASGKNALGAGGFGIYYFFSRDVSLLTGPVWFNEPALSGPNAEADWVWTTQLDINY